MIDSSKTEPTGLLRGFSTLGCPELSLRQICELLREFNLPGLEMRCVDDRMDLPQWATAQGWTRRRAAALLAKHRIQFRVASSSFKLVGNGERSRAELLDFCRWADSWGARYVRVFGGGKWGQPLTDGDYAEAAEVVDWWQWEKKRRHWRLDLLLETHDAFSASAPCRHLLARLREPIGVIWDSHHTWRLGGETPRESWAQLFPWIRHVHVKDSIAKPSARHPYTYVLPGDGEMPLEQVVEVLREHHFAGMVSLEWERQWHPYLPPLREALVRLQAQSWFAESAESPQEHLSPIVAGQFSGSSAC
jgi:sugar phosphate isomerase/epimerase